jgi:hypothetical protein
MKLRHTVAQIINAGKGTQRTLANDCFPIPLIETFDVLKTQTKFELRIAICEL